MRGWIAVAALQALLFAAEARSEAIQKTPASLQDVISTVEKSFQKDPATGLPFVTTVTADFFQSSKVTGKEGGFRADGEMTVRFATDSSPLMFRFDYFRPTNQQIMSNGRTLWIYLPENRQVVQGDVSAVFSNSSDLATRPSTFLQGLGRISRDFLITFSESQVDPEGNFLLEMTPRRSSILVSKLVMAVDRNAVLQFVANGRKLVYDNTRPERAFPIRATSVVDEKGNTSMMEFSNVRTNIWLSDGLFNFIIPGGVQIVPPARPQYNLR